MQQVRTCEKGILVQRSSWGEKADILKKDNQSSMKINSLNDCLSITGCCYQVFMLLSYWLRVQETKIKREMMMIQPKSGTLCSITKRGSWECKGPYRSFFFFFFFTSSNIQLSITLTQLSGSQASTLLQPTQQMAVRDGGETLMYYRLALIHRLTASTRNQVTSHATEKILPLSLINQFISPTSTRLSFISSGLLP